METVTLDRHGRESSSPDDAFEVALARTPLEGPCPRPPEQSLHEPGDGTFGRDHVFHEAELATWTQDPTNLAGHLRRVRHRAEHEGRDDGIDAAVKKVDAFRDDVTDLEFDACLRAERLRAECM